MFDDKIEDALELCDTQQGPVPAVLSAGLRKYYVLRKLDYDVARTEEQVVKAMDDHSVHIVTGLERHLPVLATVSSARVRIPGDRSRDDCCVSTNCRANG